MRVEIFKGSGVQPWYLRLVGANGQTLAVSEGYFSKWNAKRAAARNFAGIPLVQGVAEDPPKPREEKEPSDSQ